MVELLSSSTGDCNIHTISIPSISAALSIMTSEILNATLLLPKIQDASISLEEIIRNSNYVDLSAQQEATALKQSAHKLGHKLKFEILEIRMRMVSLEEALSREPIIPTTLSTADDVSAALHIAVINRPKIDWPLAELALERFSILCTEELMTDRTFCQNVWSENCFDNSMVNLLMGGDCWRVRKSLGLIQNIVINAHDLTVSAGFFESLASILLQPMLSAVEDDEMKWVSLIAKDQNMALDPGISRLINSFLYSRKGKSSIAYNVLNIICVLTDLESNDIEEFSPTLPFIEALVKILKEEKDNTDVLDVCLKLIRRLVTTDYDDCSDCPGCEVGIYGICQALVTIMSMYSFDEHKLNDIIEIIFVITPHGENTKKFLKAGLLRALVEVFNSPYHFEHFTELIQYLCEYDYDIFGQFYRLGIPEGSSCFG
jgi:hypothetical protein